MRECIPALEQSMPPKTDLDDLSVSSTSVLISRFSALVTLMLCQSLSSIILGRYSELLRDEKGMNVTLFLTMLVGAGGNAGNQVAVSVIRGIALQKIDIGEGGRGRKKYKYTMGSLLTRELGIGLGLSAGLCVAGYFRVIWFVEEEIRHVMAQVVTLSLFLIVITSVLVGYCLPFMFLFMGLDPAHAGPSVQVIMDIFGVFITCLIGAWLL